jgi:methyl-accepting chemotaxis protein
MKIGRKLGIVLGAIVGQLALLAALSIWSLHLVSAGVDRTREHSASMLLAWRVSSDIAEINTQMGNLLLSADLKLDNAQVISLERDHAAAIEEMNTSTDSEKGKKLVGNLQSALVRWKKTNDEVVRLSSLGKREGAIAYYRTECPDRYGDAKGAIGDLLEYRGEQLEQIKAQCALLLKQMLAALLGMGVFAVVVAMICGWKLTHSIARPLDVASLLLTRIAGGDVSLNVPEEYVSRTDEIGTLAQAMQTMSVNLRAMVREISGGIELLSSSSSELLATSTKMTVGSREASDKAHSVSAAAETMSSNIASVAVGMEQTSTNLAHVSSATEQMTSTICEIAQNSEKARGITETATRQAMRLTAQINELGNAAREIGKVTETITEISSQTNLLALNATIEAARAGAAGKGFAVVATEIKLLAKQTATATEDIKSRIAGVQSATAGGIAELAKISEVILEVSSIVASIAAAIEEQSTVTRDIARNISEACIGVKDSNVRVSKTSLVSREIAGDMVGVDHAAGEMADGGDHVRNSAGELSTVAAALRVTVARFQQA